MAACITRIESGITFLLNQIHTLNLKIKIEEYKAKITKKLGGGDLPIVRKHHRQDATLQEDTSTAGLVTI
jgi:hypothetical protein